MYTCIYEYIYVYIYMQTYVYKYIYMHIYTTYAFRMWIGFKELNIILKIIVYNVATTSSGVHKLMLSQCKFPVLP